MVILNEFEHVKYSGTSKGNQEKFYKDGYWVKLDSSRCYEGLSEEFVSKFCKCIYDFPCVDYKADLFDFYGDVCPGCMSKNMYNRLDIMFVSMRNLLKQWGIQQNIFFKDKSIENNISNVIELVYSKTNLNLLNYLSKLIFLDSLIINEDRHIMNLGLCYCFSDNCYYEAPCFDNGCSLFCTHWTYRKNKTLEENIESAKSVARPFSKFYDKQVDAMLKIGAKPLYIDYNKVMWLLNNYHNKIYSDKMNNLIKEVLKNRLEYYKGVSFKYV